jgi:hypothetical protein
MVTDRRLLQRILKKSVKNVKDKRKSKKKSKKKSPKRIKKKSKKVIVDGVKTCVNCKTKNENIDYYCGKCKTRLDTFTDEEIKEGIETSIEVDLIKLENDCKKKYKTEYDINRCINEELDKMKNKINTSVTDYYESLKRQKIICETCTVENVWDAVKCELCEKSLIKEKSENECSNCTFINESNAKECEICGQRLKNCNAKECERNVKLTMSQGDCFFSSIYRALINQNKYNTTINLVNLIYNTTFPEINEEKIKASVNFTSTKPVEKEEEFIKECRRLLSTMEYLDVGLDYLENNIEIYELLVKEYTGLSDHMKYYIEQRGKNNTINKNQISKKMKEILKTPAKYVGNEEFTTMRYILSLADIKLMGPYKSLEYLPEKITDNMVVLYNPSDVHYQYIA